MSRIIINPFTGILPIFFHIVGLVRLLYFNIQASVGTRIMLRTSVEAIPKTKVTPTERIGDTVTIWGAISTENPIIVVMAERNTATPVELAISNTHFL